MKLVFATTNPGKLRELRALIGDALEVVAAADAGAAGLEVEEDRLTFEGNAEKKARAYAEATGLPALADDSGLCVEALAGGPGVHSARFAADDAGRIRRLLEELRHVPDEGRAAAFRCALCLATPESEVVIEVGECEGRIVREPRGRGGFGYDPIFEVGGIGRTMAELTREEKAAVSHRGRAFEKMRPHLISLSARGTAGRR